MAIPALSSASLHCSNTPKTFQYSKNFHHDFLGSFYICIIGDIKKQAGKNKHSTLIKMF